MDTQTPILTPTDRAFLFVKDFPLASTHQAYLAGWNDREEELIDLKLRIAKLEAELLEAKIQHTLDENKNLIQ